MMNEQAVLKEREVKAAARIEPHFEYIAQEEGPRHQKVEASVFHVENGRAALAVDEELIGIPIILRWDVEDKKMLILLLDGSTVEINSPVPAEDIEELRQFDRVHLTTRLNNDEFIVHHVPFIIQDF